MQKIDQTSIIIKNFLENLIPRNPQNDIRIIFKESIKNILES